MSIWIFLGPILSVYRDISKTSLPQKVPYFWAFISVNLKFFWTKQTAKEIQKKTIVRGGSVTSIFRLYVEFLLYVISWDNAEL